MNNPHEYIDISHAQDKVININEIPKHEYIDISHAQDVDQRNKDISHASAMVVNLKNINLENVDIDQMKKIVQEKIDNKKARQKDEDIKAKGKKKCCPCCSIM